MIPGVSAKTYFIFLTQENGAQAAEGELKHGVQNPGGKEEDDAGVLLPHCCRLNKQLVNFEEVFKCRLCFFRKHHSHPSGIGWKN